MKRSLYRHLWWQAFLSAFSREPDQHVAFGDAELALDALRRKFPELDDADPPLERLDEDLEARSSRAPAAPPTALVPEAEMSPDARAAKDWRERFHRAFALRRDCFDRSPLQVRAAAHAALIKLPPHIAALDPTTAARRVCSICLARYFFAYADRLEGVNPGAGLEMWHENTLAPHAQETDQAVRS